MTYEGRIQQVFSWIDEDPQLTMCTLYFSLIDDIGHRYGPESRQMSIALKRLDRLIAMVWEEIQVRNLEQRTNLIILSDHGLIQAKPNKTANIYIDELIPDLQTMIDWMDYNVVTTIFPKLGSKIQRSLYSASYPSG